MFFLVYFKLQMRRVMVAMGDEGLNSASLKILIFAEGIVYLYEKTKDVFSLNCLSKPTS